MTQVFLVGGPRDGQWMDVERPEIIVYELPDPPSFRMMVSGSVPEEVEVKLFVYERGMFHTPTKDFHFGFPQGVSHEWVMERLISRYKPGVSGS